MRNRVLVILISSLLISSLIMLVANYVLITDIFTTHQGIYKTSDISNVLKDFETSLKNQSKLDPQNEIYYHDQFKHVQALKLVYGDDLYFERAVQNAILKYFFILFGLTLFGVFVGGAWLSFIIHRIYVRSFDELVKEKEKSRYLGEMAKWQEIAKKLAHEIRRPLQPMRIWLSQLKSVSSADAAIVKEAATAIDQEVLFLSEMVTGFSDFAQIPKPRLETVDLADFIQSFVAQYGDVWPGVKFEFQKPTNVHVALDPKIFRTLLTNMVENAVEANPDSGIDVRFGLRSDDDSAYIHIFNSGVSLDEIEREKIFDIYYSTKTNAKNRGLGLSIVKTIVLEHGGDINCVCIDGGVKFEIQLPLVKG